MSGNRKHSGVIKGRRVFLTSIFPSHLISSTFFLHLAGILEKESENQIKSKARLGNSGMSPDCQLIQI